jgi:hypothetical protein
MMAPHLAAICVPVNCVCACVAIALRFGRLLGCAVSYITRHTQHTTCHLYSHTHARARPNTRTHTHTHTHTHTYTQTHTAPLYRHATLYNTRCRCMTYLTGRGAFEYPEGPTNLDAAVSWAYPFHTGRRFQAESTLRDIEIGQICRISMSM